jgi:replicative DNA helicase
MEDAAADDLEVREGPADPPAVNIVRPTPFGFLLDDGLNLSFCSHEEDALPLGGLFAHKKIGPLKHLQGFGEVDDVDPLPLGVDELAHLGVPFAGPVPEMDPGFQEFLHREQRQTSSFPALCGRVYPGLLSTTTAPPQPGVFQALGYHRIVLEGEVRHVPRNPEAEQVVLGAAMLAPEEVLPRILTRLRPEHFYFKAHQDIYRTILELFEHGQLPDVVTVANRLEERGKLEGVGGRTYLQELLLKVPATAAVEHYAEIVEQKALRRWLIEAAAKIAELGYTEEFPLEEVLDRAEEAIFTIAERRSMPGYFLLRDFLPAHLEVLEELHKDPKRRPVTAISTGFQEFDTFTAGLHPADLIVIAGRPGTGKTALALGIARDAALHQGKKVGIFSLEMSKEQVLERLLCAEAQVDLHRLRSGYLPPAKWGLIAAAAGRLNDAVILIDDTPNATVLSIKAKARQMMREHGLDLVIVDYLQLVEAGIKTDVREQQIAYVSRTLKGMARELGIPVIACSQLNRQVERRGEDARPKLSDLRESGAIEQDADLVVFIHRPEGKKGSDAPVVETEIIVAKQRNGPTGSFRLLFHKGFVSFYSPTKEAEEVPF